MSTLSLPRFKLPAKSKTKAWAEEVLMYSGNSLSLYSSTWVRNSVEEKLIALDLYNGVIHPQDLMRVVNPLDLNTIDTSRELQHYPIAAPLIDLLVGEEINRPYEPLVHITNNIAVEEKAGRKRAYAEAEMAKIEEAFQGDEEGLKKAIVELKRKLKFSYKDIVEKKGSALLNHYWQELEMFDMFVEGYRRMYCVGEEVYEIDIVHNEPTIRIINSVKLRVYGGGNSSRIEDSDIIVVEDHFSIGYLIDRYGDELNEQQIDQLLDFQAGLGTYDKTYGDVSHEFRPRILGEILGNEISSNYIDSQGNIRHLRVRWRAYKMVKIIEYIDPTTGAFETKYRADNYRLQEGESLKKKIWIYDWWIGTLIAADMMVDIKPIPIRLNRVSTPIEGHCGLVGEVFNLNERKVKPQMGRMKPYQYLYDVIIDNIITAMSKNIGPILEMDMAKKPVKWDTKQWLHYMTKYNVKFVDSFKEVKKGPAMGQLAGHVAQGKDQIVQLDFGNYIQQLINLAEYLENAMSEIIGITPQRKGAISNRETVGGVERATSQSSHMTEWYAHKHTQLKTRVLNVFVEAAKVALKDNPKKLQNIVDGNTREMLDVMGEDFANVDLGVFVTNSAKAQAHKQILEQAAHAYMQNGGEFSFVFDVLFSESMADKRRLIEEHEEDAKAQAAEERNSEQKAMQEAAQMAAQTETEKLDMEKYKADLEAEVKIKLKEIDLQIAREKNDVVSDGQELSAKEKIAALQVQMENEFNKDQLKDKELNIKNKEVDKKPVSTPSSN